MSLLPGGPPPRQIVVMRHSETVDNAARVWQGAPSDRVFRGLDNCHWIELVAAGKSFSATLRWRISGWNLGPWTT